MDDESNPFGALFGPASPEQFLSARPLYLAADPPMSSPPRAVVIGAPGATPYPGFSGYAVDAPSVIRAAAAASLTAPDRFDFDLDGPLWPDASEVADAGDLFYDPSAAADNRRRIFEAVAKIRALGAAAVVLGGDDSVPIPVVDALAGDGPITVVQFDAHLDWRDSVDGERLGLSSTMRRCSEMAHVERIVQIGLRGCGSGGPQEAADARAWGARIIPAQALLREGVGRAMTPITPGARVVVDFDVDALDPSAAPGVIGPSPGGLSTAMAVALLRALAARATLLGVCFVEFAPARDVAGMTALATARLAALTLGLILRQRR